MLIVSMAVHQATNVLLRSSLFASLRDKFEQGDGIRFMPGIMYVFLQRLFGCPWCMSIQLSWILLVPFALEVLVHYSVILWLVSWAGKWFDLALAVSMGANLLHEVFKHEGPGNNSG